MSDYVDITLSKDNLALLRMAVRHAAREDVALSERFMHLLYLLGGSDA